MRPKQGLCEAAGLKEGEAQEHRVPHAPPDGAGNVVAAQGNILHQHRVDPYTDHNEERLEAQSIFVGLCTQVLSICIFLVIYGRMIEVYLVTSIGPIPFATMANREWGNTGQNYLRSLLALGFLAFLIMICVGIYAVLVEGISLSGDNISCVSTTPR